jgi:hypothetical protein
MPIGPTPPIDLELQKTVPTPVEATTLQKQLIDIGLSCELLEHANLDKYITQVKAQLVPGSTQSFGIRNGAGSPAGTLALDLGANDSVFELSASSAANWVPEINEDNKAYVHKLGYLQLKEHFEWLKTAQGTEFSGLGINENKYSGIKATVTAIKQQFVQVAFNVSATLLSGLDKTDMESVLSNVIATVPDDAKNYDPGPMSKVVYLVDNFNPVSKTADAIGVLTVEYDLSIQNYKKSSNQPLKHKYKLDIQVWAMVYYEISKLDSDFEQVLAHFGTG